MVVLKGGEAVSYERGNPVDACNETHNQGGMQRSPSLQRQTPRAHGPALAHIANLQIVNTSPPNPPRPCSAKAPKRETRAPWLVGMVIWSECILLPRARSTPASFGRFGGVRQC